MLIPSARSISRQKQREWFLLLAALALVGSFLALSHFAEVERDEASESDRLQVLANVIATNIETNLNATNLAVESVIHDFLPGPRGVVGSSDDVSRRLSALEAAIPGVRGMLVVDADGVITASSKPGFVGTKVTYREYFSRPQGQPDKATLYVSAPFQSMRKEVDLVITVTRMVPGAGGRFNGVVVAVIDRDYFSGIVSSVIYAPDVWAMLVHGDGRQFLNFPEKKPGDGIDLGKPGTFFSRHRATGKVANVLTGPVYTNNEPRMMALHTVQPVSLHMDKPIVVGLSRSLSAIASPLHRKALAIGGAFGILLAMCCGGLYWMQSRRGYIQALGADLERERQEADERNKFTFALRESEARFRTLIEDAPLAIAILRRGHFEYTNPRYRALHGYERADDINGLPWRAMLADESRALLRENEALIDVDSPIEQRFEALGLGKDGLLVPVLKTTARVELADGPATLIFVQDISAQKRAESAMLQARDAAETANRSKAEFLANMSHEIRSPLNAILGLAYLLEQTRLEAEARNMVHKIRTSGRTLLGIINDILDVSKIEAGHMVLERAPFRLGDVIDNVAGAMGIAAGDKNIELIIHPLPAHVNAVIGDALRLEQVLTNLSSNAIKFTNAGRVELSVELLTCVGEVAELRFNVQDTGIGIAPENQSEVFSAFMQADSSTTRRFGGTGLGLAICRQLVGLMDGEIGLNSSLGHGSHFWFTLPLQQISSADFSSVEMVCVEALIVDDSEIALQAAGAIAQGLGWQVNAVDSGESALAHVHQRKGGKLPTVVILDWKMPGMDGLDTARAIRESVAVDEWPIVIMATAYSLSALSGQPGAEMVDAILTKPVTASGLYNAVIEAQHRRTAAVGLPQALRQNTGHSLDGIRVLIVDDSEINREVAQLILREQGAQISLAVDGKAALDWLLMHPDDVDLVLMDVQMPVMDGIEATRRLRLLPQFKDLPIVALTAGAFKSQQDAARAAGMVEFISKPFDVPSTIALIQRLRRRPGETSAAVLPSLEDSGDVTLSDAFGPAGASGAPIDIVRGLQIWSDVRIYRDYLRRFIEGYAGTADTINASLAANDRAAAAALAHKLAGVAANLALPATQQLAGEAERLLANGYDPTPVLTRLREELERVAQAIARYAPAPQPVEADVQPAIKTLSDGDRAGLKARLVDLLAALDTDNPAPVETILGALGAYLPAQQLTAIWTSVRGFDFRAAEAIAIQIATQHDLTLEE